MHSSYRGNYISMSDSGCSWSTSVNPWNTANYPSNSLALKSVERPAISPDGAWIAYTVESVDTEADESTTQVFMVSRDGGDVVQLTADDYSASSPRWSPDGQKGR